MVNYRYKLNIDFDLSDAQIEILKRDSDTIVRAVPGSGKTTILTLKIKNLLRDNPDINQMCCISYTNVNVEDLEKSCTERISGNNINKIIFLTFHRFCLEYILNPFSYLYRSNKGFRPYKKIFNYNDYGIDLLNYLRVNGVPEKDINSIKDQEKIFYNIKFNPKYNKWLPVTSGIDSSTAICYWNFLRENRMIDFNLISLFSLLIVQENMLVRLALNKSIDWIFIDEFQDVSEIQCKIIEAIRKSKKNNSNELKWLLVGDPNQSIYGFAGANPKSMYDIREIFNNLNNSDCEIKLDKTYRCSSDVFNYARENYNRVLGIVKDSKSVKSLQDSSIINYIEDLFVPENVTCSHSDGSVIQKNALNGVVEILHLKFSELIEDEVCCIGVSSYNSFEVYSQYRRQITLNEGENFNIYSELYRDYDDKYGSKYFSLFIRYLFLKKNFYNNRLKFHSSINKYVYLLKQLLVNIIPEEAIDNNRLFDILCASCDLSKSLNPSNSVSYEFNNFLQRLCSCLNAYFPDYLSASGIVVGENIKGNFNNIQEPNIEGFIQFAMKGNNEKITFDIKHIHKIKGLEYDQVIVQKIEELPYKPHANKVHQAIFHGGQNSLVAKDVYDYIQELNKLYVMLTRSRKNLYVIINNNKLPELVNVEIENGKIS